jgi:selenophosphate synthase
VWLDTPATLVKADATRTSHVPWATAAELQAIQNGTVTEVIDAAKVPLVDPATGTPLTVAQIDGLIQQNGQASLPKLQADLNASAPPANWVGAYYDDSTGTWTGLPS